MEKIEELEERINVAENNCPNRCDGVLNKCYRCGDGRKYKKFKRLFWKVYIEIE